MNDRVRLSSDRAQSDLHDYHDAVGQKVGLRSTSSARLVEPPEVVGYIWRSGLDRDHRRSAQLARSNPDRQITVGKWSSAVPQLR